MDKGGGHAGPLLPLHAEILFENLVPLNHNVYMKSDIDLVLEMFERAGLTAPASPAREPNPFKNKTKFKNPRQRYLAKLSVAARQGKMLVELDGISKPRYQWALDAGLTPGMLRKRLARGMSLRAALALPPTLHTRETPVGEVVAYVMRLKDNPCKDCGSKFISAAMEFDHRPGEKKVFNISNARRHDLPRVIAEIAKCDLVCACCHRLRTKARAAS